MAMIYLRGKKWYVRGATNTGRYFDKSSWSTDRSEAERLAQLWESGRLLPGHTEESNTISETRLQQSPLISSPNSLPLLQSFPPSYSSSLPNATEPLSNVIQLFPEIPTVDDQTNIDLGNALGFAPPVPTTEVPKPLGSLPIIPTVEDSIKKLKRNQTLCEFCGHGIAVVFVGSIIWGYKQLDRESGKPSKEQLKELGDAFGDQLKEWFGDANLKPWHRIVLLSLVIAFGMWSQGKPIPKPEKIPEKKPELENVA